MLSAIVIPTKADEERLPRGDFRGNRQRAWKASLRQSLCGFCASDGRSKGSH
ncbi:hypothetical protein SLEP1_g26903 [Rubroshorea leprosula]|uniref:Uncharacterized protein n=1 Tax=Rubroshorea leprosula TaxID=152421 RepID=A0AAV5JV04_9ROSI|nr:hypothetical protein SLEP1_g26903 [Rubroshorea leprosula]